MMGQSRTPRFSVKAQTTMAREKGIAAQPTGDHLLTIREAAEVLRLSRRTVREYVKRGEIRGKIKTVEISACRS